MMARTQAATPKPDKKLAYWATVENYRWWLAHDQVYRRLIDVRGEFSADIVRTIAKAYGVNRGIPTSIDRAADVAHALNSFDATAFAKLNLASKIEKFRDVVKSMPMNQGEGAPANPTFVSGTSKLVWFAAPKGWTMFDRLAADGMGITKTLPSMSRAEDFYDKLNKRGFEEVVDKARPIFGKGSFKALSAERLVDKYLWLAGCKGEAIQNSKLTLGYYMQGLFPKVKAELHDLATEIGETLQGDLDVLRTGKQ